MTTGGAAAGKFEVKSCGRAHAWCAVCRPEMAEKLRKPKRARKEYERPCRDCGRCDACIGLVAPEGMKVCRKCGDVKPIDQFAPRLDTGGRRNHCNRCRNGVQKTAICGCGTRFILTTEGRSQCPRCRPPITKPCARCGTEFVGSMEQRQYCSPECRDEAGSAKRAAAYRRQRMEALLAYSDGPEASCSCCGESTLEFLALDHENGGGRKHRQETGGGGFYSWLRRNNYPEGFRVLCHNCNLGREFNGGVCPHVTAAALAA